MQVGQLVVVSGVESLGPGDGSYHCVFAKLGSRGIIGVSG